MAVETSNVNHTNNNSAIILPPTMSRRDSSNFTAASNLNVSQQTAGATHNKAHSSNPTKSQAH